ncbi:WD40-repeat-containing domain protein [Mycena rosella]|uniref:WD40-repeat-containing domain protein n=1 Tax=Mycena rosella TaxID=1033263 RepID=A0AAD7GSF0_MYCRO|nr:WD40-repeat-containing domain protein [Mycena rosella]
MNAALVPFSTPPSTPPSRLRRRGSPAAPPNPSARFSRLLTSVLGSPFLTTAEMASLPPHLDLVDGDDTAVPHSDIITRPPSPDPGEFGLYGFEVVQREDGEADWPFKRSPFRSLLPRLWDVLSASPPRRQSPFSYNYSTSSIWALKPIDYTQLPPLDGEEGELVDDEACFFCPPVRAVTGIDILTLLPPELALHVLALLLSSAPPSPHAPAPTVLAGLTDHAAAATAALHALITCRSVSRKWALLASDSAVWRAAFVARWGLPRLPPPLAPPPMLRHSSTLDARMKKLPPLPPDAVSQVSHTPAPTPAALARDWRTLYRARLELDRSWAGPAEPRVTALAGHADSVYCLEFSRTHIITGSRDRSVKVWGLRSGRLLGTFAGGHQGSVLCLKFEFSSFDAKTDGDDDDGLVRGFMVTGSSDCTDAPVQGEVRAVLRGHGGGVLDLRIDDKWIVSCSKDAAIRVWARDTLALHRTLRGHEGPVNAVGLQSGSYGDAADDGDDSGRERHSGRVVSASGDGKMILWDIASGERVRTFEGHDRGLACIEFKEDLIISGSNDCKIKIWSASTGACLRTLAGHEALVRALAFDVPSGRLVSASYDKSVRVWDLGSGRLVREFRESHTSHIFDVKFDERRIVSTSHDQKIVVLDFGAGLGVDAGLLV